MTSVATPPAGTSPRHHRTPPLSPAQVQELQDQKKKGLPIGASFRKALSPASWAKKPAKHDHSPAEARSPNSVASPLRPADDARPAAAPAAPSVVAQPVLVDEKNAFEVAALGAQAVRNLRINLTTMYISATRTYLTLVVLVFWIFFVEVITYEGMETSWLGRVRYVGGGRGLRLIGLTAALLSMATNHMPRQPRYDRIPAFTHQHGGGSAAAAASTRSNSSKDVSFKSVEEPATTALQPASASVMPNIPSIRSSVKAAVAELPFDKRFSMSTAVLGKGQYSVVRKAVDLVSFQDVAVKCMDRGKLTADDERAVVVEVGILQQLKHPNVIRLLAWVEDPSWHYLVLELCEGGELFDRIVEKEYYTEREARKVAFTLASCLRYLHSRGIVHRDIKPENILLTNKHDDATLKIADFGFATHVKPEGLLTSCGTPTYVAPEILTAKPYGTSVDCWSFGVILYILLAGFPPFSGNGNKNIMLAKIKMGDYEFNPEYWSGVSVEAKSLIKGCLQVSVAKRFTMEQICEHKWFSKLPKPAVETQLEHTISQMHLFNAKRKLRASIKLAIAANRMADLAKLVQATTGPQQPSHHSRRPKETKIDI